MIWGHSFMPASVSSNESNFVLSAFNDFISTLGTNWQITAFAVRKAAHFSEFFILGLLFTKALRTVFAAWPLPFDSCTLSMGLFVAVCDEFIQYFSPGRASLISDVMIDFSGVVCAVFLCFIVHKIQIRRRRIR